MSRSTEFLYSPDVKDLSKVAMHKGYAIALQAMAKSYKEPKGRRETFVKSAMHHDMEAHGAKRNMRTSRAEKLFIPKLTRTTYAGMSLN